MTQLSMEPVNVRRCKSNLHAQPCWHGACAACGKPLTAFDWDEDECREVALAYLEDHRCGA